MLERQLQLAGPAAEQKLQDHNLASAIVKAIHSLGIVDEPPAFVPMQSNVNPNRPVIPVQRGIVQRVRQLLQWNQKGQNNVPSQTKESVVEDYDRRLRNQFVPLNAWLEQVTANGKLLDAIRSWYLRESSRPRPEQRRNIVALDAGKAVSVIVDGVPVSISLAQNQDGTLKFSFDGIRKGAFIVDFNSSVVSIHSMGAGFEKLSDH
jgi:hypothetical protein